MKSDVKTSTTSGASTSGKKNSSMTTVPAKITTAAKNANNPTPAKKPGDIKKKETNEKDKDKDCIIY